MPRLPFPVRPRPQTHPALLPLCALLGAVACGGLEADPVTGQLVAGLANGSPDVAHPAVGLVLSGTSDCKDSAGPGIAICTGTLVGRHTVVTAGHCVDDTTVPYAFCPTGGVTRTVARVLAHPGFLATQHLGLGRSADDIGLLVLRDDVLDRPAAVVAARAPVVGETATVVGWGVMSERGDEPQGQARSGSKAITAVAPKAVETEPVGASPAVCSGDSGGPLLVRQGDRDLVLGVVSTSVSPEGALCSTGTEYYTRADIYREWIAATPGADLRPLVDPVGTPTPSDNSTYRLLFDGLAEPQPATNTAGQIAGVLEPTTTAQPTTTLPSNLVPSGGEEIQGVTCATATAGAAAPRGAAGALPWLLTLVALALRARRRDRATVASVRR